MSKPTEASKRRVPMSAALLPEEIEEVKAAAREKAITMSDFVREAAVVAARRVNAKAALKRAS